MGYINMSSLTSRPTQLPPESAVKSGEKPMFWPSGLASLQAEELEGNGRNALARYRTIIKLGVGGEPDEHSYLQLRCN